MMQMLEAFGERGRAPPAARAQPQPELLLLRLPEPARRASKRASPSGGGSTPAAAREEEDDDEMMLSEHEDDAEDSGDGEEASSRRELSGHVRHNVADAIANRSTKKKMIDTVQIECSTRQRHDFARRV